VSPRLATVDISSIDLAQNGYSNLILPAPKNKARMRPNAVSERATRAAQLRVSGWAHPVGARLSACAAAVYDRAAHLLRPLTAHPVIVHLIDGTYELFRHFYGLRRFTKGTDRPGGAVVGVLNTVLQMLEEGATHLGVATDHIIESFRNRLWPGYKTGEGVEPALLAQFQLLEDALAAMGVPVWPMIELEADDALASAARIAGGDARIAKVSIWTPDKDLAQCVRDERVVQVDRRTRQIRDAAAVRRIFGVEPRLIPDLLALAGDAADGYPGLPGIGRKTAARLIEKYGRLEDFPVTVLGERRELALLFKNLATLRTDASLFADVEELRWPGPRADFAGVVARLGEPRLLTRANRISLS